jgi:hypothetical protein
MNGRKIVGLLLVGFAPGLALRGGDPLMVASAAVLGVALLVLSRR